MNILNSPLFNTQMDELFERVDELYLQETVYPSKPLVFEALRYTSFENAKVVIVGQDPYFNPGQAHGLAFSVNDGIKIPPSLRNIFKEIAQSQNCNPPQNGNLTLWAEQGVLLLNAHLTVRAGEALSHEHVGWPIFTDAIIQALSHRGNVVFMLWGKDAKSKAKYIDQENNQILLAPHPSPLSAYRGFLGCGHFKKANDSLVKYGEKPIDWCTLNHDLFSNIDS